MAALTLDTLVPEAEAPAPARTPPRVPPLTPYAEAPAPAPAPAPSPALEGIDEPVKDMFYRTNYDHMMYRSSEAVAVAAE